MVSAMVFFGAKEFGAYYDEILRLLLYYFPCFGL